MKIVRAVQKEDLDGLMYLAAHSGEGMTTLKPDKKMLSDRIGIACASFTEQIPPEQRDYLFVMEDADNGKVVGVCAIKSTVGLDEPFYNYRTGTLVHASKELNVYSRMDTLHLSNDLTGYSELCSLFLLPDYRTSTNGKLLAKSRLLFIAQFPHLFGEKLMAELRGFQHPDGSSPFWDNLGRHFFKMELNRADDLCSAGKKSFIAELMPRHPLYIVYLPKEAQEVIGKVHVDSVPARCLLEQEGFYYEGFVDIFDAGPVLQARINALRSVRLSELVKVVDGTGHMITEQPTLIANTSLQDYRVIVSDVAPENGCVQLNDKQQQALHCATHAQFQAQVRAMPLNIKKSQE